MFAMPPLSDARAGHVSQVPVVTAPAAPTTGAGAGHSCWSRSVCHHPAPAPAISPVSSDGENSEKCSEKRVNCWSDTKNSSRFTFVFICGNVGIWSVTALYLN